MGYTNTNWEPMPFQAGNHLPTSRNSLAFWFERHGHELAEVDLPQEDWQGSCEVWEQHGQCVQNPGFM